MEEDLNLYRMRIRILTKCWFDMETFPNIKDIITVTGLSGTLVYVLAREAKLPKRTKANIKKYLNH